MTEYKRNVDIAKKPMITKIESGSDSNCADATG